MSPGLVKGGTLAQILKRFFEEALPDRDGRAPGLAENGRAAGTKRNGRGQKKVKTAQGEVTIETL